MTRVIHKFPIRITDTQDVNMPFGADIVSVQVQGDQVCAWAIIDAWQPIGPRRLMIVGTGNEFSDGLAGDYVATVQHGSLVWHVFDGGYCS